MSGNILRDFVGLQDAKRDARVSRLAGEEIAKHCDARIETARKALEHIMGMAGNPDAAEGCRVIIKRARRALRDLGFEP